MRDRLDEVRVRIASAALRSGRDPAAVRLVAVTKGQPVSAVRAAVTAGVTDIGESRVQEALAKQRELPGAAITWHMLGHLQQNKAAAAARIFSVVQSVDSDRIGTALARRRTAGQAMTALIEVELTGIPGRTGVAPEAVDGLLATLLSLPSLLVVGLMTIAPPGSPSQARDCFSRLRVLRDRLADAHGLPLPELSMGMSDDFELAVEEGSTLVRLGRVLFGPRPPVS